MGLEGHRIERISIFEISSRYPRRIGKNARLADHGTGSTLRACLIFTSGGAEGWGISTIEEESVPELIGRPLEELFDPEVGVLRPEAKLIDIPLHDLAGAILGLPVHRMLGSEGEAAVPCYDGSIYMDDLDDPRGVEAVLESCRQGYEMGYRAFKLKIGRGYRWMEKKEGLRRDIEVTRRVREEFPDCLILVDANDGYTPELFIDYLREVIDCRLYWVEEPFREEREGLRRVREFLRENSPETLIADGESRPDLDQLLKLAEEGLLDVLLMDVIGFGFSEWRKLMPQLVELGVRASPHAWGNPLKTLYIAHLAAGAGNIPIVEGVPGRSDQANWGSYRLAEGRLILPPDPGFGVRLISPQAP